MPIASVARGMRSWTLVSRPGISMQLNQKAQGYALLIPAEFKSRKSYACIFLKSRYQIYSSPGDALNLTTSHSANGG